MAKEHRELKNHRKMANNDRDWLFILFWIAITAAVSILSIEINGQMADYKGM